MWQDRDKYKASGLAWIEAGGGPPVVLIHGVGLRAEAWAAQIHALSQSHRVMAVDMAGHGDSDPLPASPALADYSDRISVLLQTGGRPSVVAGHSMGALIALDLAIRYPDLVAAVMPCNAVYRRSPQAAEAVRARADAMLSGAAMDVAAPLSRWFPDAEADSPERDACRAWLEAADLGGYAAAYNVFAQEDGPADADLRELHCPATFLTGDLEPNSTPAMSHAMAALVPDAEVVIVPGSYHMTPMTHAHLVTEALLRLIGRVGTSH